MYEINLDWAQFKSEILAKGHPLNYTMEADSLGEANSYTAFCIDRQILWQSIVRSEADITDFETNYKANGNKNIDPVDEEGKTYVRAESRPLNCTTCFTTSGDDLTSGAEHPIGNGPRMFWDASEPSGDVWVAAGEEDDSGYTVPAGMKRFTVDLQFMDSIWLKEGTIYCMSGKKGSWMDMTVLCPPGGYYMNLGQIKQNTSGDWLEVDHYLNKHPLQGDVPMGDEVNTEACSQELPSYLMFRMSVTVPASDNDSYGYMEMELYRQRTVVA